MENNECRQMPLLGDKFPQMTVQTTHGEKNLPGDYNGKWLVLFSHPGDFTPVCTTEFVAFEHLTDKFKALNCELLGLSIDQLNCHIKWTEWIKEKLNTEITFPIIADTGKVANTLGIIHPGKGTTTVRAVFIIDDKGVIRLILYYPQEMGRNMQEILRCVEGLQIVDKNKVSLPADWPDNEVLGKNHVVVSPPKTVDAIKERLAEAKDKGYACLDWWLCHKELKK